MFAKAVVANVSQRELALVLAGSNNTSEYTGRLD